MDSVDRTESFVAEVLAEMRAQGAADVEFDAERFAVAYRREPEHTAPVWMYLSTLFAECQREPDTRTDRIRRYVTTLLGIEKSPVEWEAVRPLLRPVLRGAMFGRSGDSSRPDVLRRPAQPFLDELVVVDRPTSMSYVTTAMTATWEVDDEAVFAAARANLAATATVPEGDPAEGPVLLRFVDDGDAYWPSHLLLDGWLAGLAEQVGGVPVAFVPDGNSMLVTAAEPDALVPLLELVADEYQDAPRRLSPMGYSVDAGGRVIPYVPPPDHPVVDLVDRAERLLATREYAAQHDLLEAAGLPEYVATLWMFERDDGSLFTTVAWAVPNPTLLPRADFLSVVVDGAEPFSLAWENALEHELVEEAVEYRPARFRTASGVDPALLPRLRALAVEP